MRFKSDYSLVKTEVIMEENSKGKIVPPSKRKLMLIKKIEELRDGGIHSYANDGSKHPRTAIGLDKTGTIMIWVVIDGRQSFSEGVSLYETANIMLDAGSYDAVNMDGGGTSTMAMSTNLRPMIINNPCNWITPPFFERSGGNHLGIGLKD